MIGKDRTGVRVRADVGDAKGIGDSSGVGGSRAADQAACWCLGINHQGPIGRQGASSAGGGQGKGGVIPGGILNRAAIQDEGMVRELIEISRAITSSNRVGEGEGSGARAGGVGGIAIGSPGFEPQHGGAPAGGDSHRIAELHGEGEQRTDAVAAVSRAGGYGCHRGAVDD